MLYTAQFTLLLWCRVVWIWNWASNVSSEWQVSEIVISYSKETLAVMISYFSCTRQLLGFARSKVTWHDFSYFAAQTRFTYIAHSTRSKIYLVLSLDKLKNGCNQLTFYNKLFFFCVTKVTKSRFYLLW